MVNTAVDRFRIEDASDDLVGSISLLLSLGKSSEAMNRLSELGFLENTSVMADVVRIEKDLLNIHDSLPENYLKGQFDGPAAAIVHGSLNLTPAQASDRGLWVSISILGLKYVKTRWANVPIHVFGSRSDHAWERLWWVGELLGVNGDYQYCLDFSMNTNATNEVNRHFLREKAWAVAFAQLVGRYNPDRKPGPITDSLMNDLSKKMRVLSTTVPLPTPYRAQNDVWLVDEEKLSKQVRTALLLIKDQLSRTPMHSNCGFVWPS